MSDLYVSVNRIMGGADKIGLFYYHVVRICLLMFKLYLQAMLNQEIQYSFSNYSPISEEASPPNYTPVHTGAYQTPDHSIPSYADYNLFMRPECYNPPMPTAGTTNRLQDIFQGYADNRVSQQSCSMRSIEQVNGLGAESAGNYSSSETGSSTDGDNS